MERFSKVGQVRGNEMSFSITGMGIALALLDRAREGRRLYDG